MAGNSRSTTVPADTVLPEVFVCLYEDIYDIRRSRHGHNQMPFGLRFVPGNWSRQFRVNAQKARNMPLDGVSLLSTEHPNG